MDLFIFFDEHQDHELKSHAINASIVNYARIKKLKGRVDELEVNKVEMKDKWKILNQSMIEQSNRHKEQVEILDAEYRKLEEVNKR
ncbi:hypothetical protein JCGZ_07846 [Jatropha curcas]|uniref:Uncharacterized protein n=1 Tax=Jatropha curcas TaxID=180498 RepID=A0A067KN39_JATCU|nr:hypothetical protein JCGZ_07846 [Jatropha curcas]